MRGHQRGTLDHSLTLTRLEESQGARHVGRDRYSVWGQRRGVVGGRGSIVMGIGIGVVVDVVVVVVVGCRPGHFGST